MREGMDLVGRAPNEPRLDTSLDEHSGEHVFALKEKGETLAVARLEKYYKPLECFYLRRVVTTPGREDQGNAAILMQEVADLFIEHGDVGIAYEDVFEKTGSLLKGSGWRKLDGHNRIWALNLPLEQEDEAKQLIADLENEERL